MRILFTTQVGAGHWRPVAPLALAARAAGHEVAFATTPFGCEVIAAHGFRCFPAGIDDWRAPRPPVPAGSATPTAPPQAEAVWGEVFVDVRAAHAIPDLLAICAAWHPDLIVREMTEFGGPIVAERLGLPHAAVQVGAYRPDLEHAIGAALDRQRAAVGLPPDRGGAMLHRHLLLTPVPPSLQSPDRPLPAVARAMRWASFDLERPGDADPPAWLAQGFARPVVYATLGTAYNRTPGVFAAILAALRDEPVTAIVALGPGLDPADFGPQPPHLRLVPYLPQSLALPHCDLVIAHGGYSTVLASLAAGLPLLLLPIAADQPDNARRCVALGAGLALDPQDRTAAAIRAAARELLRAPRYRENARRIAAEMAAQPDLAEAVALLEGLATGRRSLGSADPR